MFDHLAPWKQNFKENWNKNTLIYFKLYIYMKDTHSELTN